MISAAEFAAYNRAVAKIGDRAASDVEAAVLAWCRAHEGATVAEKREAAKLIMEGFVQGYDDVAAEFAAQWYDDLAERNGARLQQAVTMTTYKPKSVDEVARYQAKKLVKGGDAAFARACGEYARNDAFRSLNETIISNVGRDKDRGVRFARVPTGFETCTFCIMLASRGAVYHTRKSAGEFKHFHRHCDCKVVPGFEDDPDAELVEGVRPEELRDLYVQLNEIDEDAGLSAKQKEALKRRAINLAAVGSDPSTGYRADNLDLSALVPGELKKMQKKNPLEWESYVQLSRLGYRQRLLHEQGSATANIDIELYLDGMWSYWDMKTIEGGVHALKKRMTECHSKWVRLSSEGAVLPDGINIELLDNPRVVIDNRFSKITDAEAEAQIRKSEDYLSGKNGFNFERALLICKDGTAKLIE